MTRANNPLPTITVWNTVLACFACPVLCISQWMAHESFDHTWHYGIYIQPGGYRMLINIYTASLGFIC